MSVRRKADDSMSMKWWMYLSAFSSSVTFMILGMTQGKFEFVAIGVMIGIALYFTRKQIQ